MGLLTRSASEAHRPLRRACGLTSVETDEPGLLLKAVYSNTGEAAMDASWLPYFRRCIRTSNRREGPKIRHRRQTRTVLEPTRIDWHCSFCMSVQDLLHVKPGVKAHDVEFDQDCQLQLA
jgi:hypothetical protein